MSTPPFRADHVGSYLRPAALKEARAKRQAGEIDAAALRAVEDHEIAAVVRRQEEVGLKAVSDGEFRRAWWHFDFFDALVGADIVEIDHGIQFQGTQTKAQGIALTGPIDFANHPFLDHFRYLASQASALPKLTIPSPSVMHFRQSDAGIRGVYGDIDAYYDDLAKLYIKAMGAFYDAGCRYLQLDDTVWAYLCSEKELAGARERGHDTDRIVSDYVRTLNRVLAAKPADMTVAMHVCRGNFRSTWISEGGYEPVAEQRAASSPCATSPKATRRSCSGSSPQRAASSRARTPSSAASMPPAPSSAATSSASAPNAASPPPRKATC